MSKPDQSPDAELPVTPTCGGAFRHDILALCALGLLVALTTRGHFAKPHPDLHEFLDSGRALLSRELPPTTKRAPLYGVLVVGVAKLLPVEAPERVAAEWINVALLPACVVLIYLIGRRWLGGAARWAAAWFAILPMSLYLSGHIIVEIFLTFMVLLTVFAAQRRIGWAYVLAAAAVMTRYDVAGLIPGVFLADWLQRRRPRPALRNAVLASVPLVAWLLLTALTWSDRAHDHYLSQIAEKGTTVIGIPIPPPNWVTLWSPFENVVDFGTLRLPPLLFELDPWLRGAAFWGLMLAALIGTVVKLLKRDAAAIVAVSVYAFYALAHVIFPFHFERFGYPMAPLVILAAGAGIRDGLTWLKPSRHISLPTRTALLLLIGTLVAAALIGEADSFGVRTGLRNPWTVSLAFLAAVLLALLWASPLQSGEARLGQAVLLMTAVLVAALHIRSTLELMGSGQEDRNQTEAARWVARKLPAEARVLSISPGLLRLYAGHEPRGRFFSFGDIEAESWPDILAECKLKGIGYIIWHDQFYDRQGDYYANKYRLQRFKKSPESIGGVIVEQRYANYPTLLILRIE